MRSLKWKLYLGAALVGMFICLLVVIFQIFTLLASVVGGSEETTPSNLPPAMVSEAVLQYQDVFLEAMKEYGVSEEYLPVLLAMCMQESGGQGNDVMQSSESKSGQIGTITTPKESIFQGVKYFASLIESAELSGPSDEDRLKVVVQSYNFGGGFIGYADSHGGKYTPALALGFSQMMAMKMGWNKYGDPLYIEHVWRYLQTSTDGDAGVSGAGEFKIPVINPVITSGFGPRWGTNHRGIDFGQPISTPIGASQAGTVEFASFGQSGSGFGGFGNCVLVNHHNGYWTLYAHMSVIKTSVGQNVKVGQIIGEVGSTGDSTGPHLHLEIRTEKMGGQVDPYPFLYPS
ncbi:lysozyme family protein [Listeria seeligeri]|uniref:lysozyme family protein n=1 Tax=Listeria seeligeri TaxID=1640 RepID=UPI0022EAF479|nr:lysozyme family protein [Listeria seeligeri]